MVAYARRRPGLYYASPSHIHPVDYQLEAVGAYLNFLHAALGQDNFGAPTTIEFVTCGEHHFAIAYGYRSPINYPSSENLCDWIRVQTQATPGTAGPLGPLIWLNGIVLMSNHCIVDLSTPTEHIRQAFHEGMPVTMCEHLRDADTPSLTPYLSIHFTLSRQVIAARTLTIEQLLNSWKWWRGEHSNPKRAGNNLRFYLPLVPHARVKFKAYSDTNFVFRLDWTRDASTDYRLTY